MPDNPLVSVIMPAYNASRYVGDAVESVLAQTYRNFEYIIIDDGSTDGTTQILQRLAHKDPRIRLVSRPNTGYAVALNEALGLAQGPFIARMDADDICLPERFQKEVDYLNAHPECVLVGTRVMLIDPDGAPLWEMEGIEIEHDQIEKQLLVCGWSIVHPAVMMRRDVVDRIGGYKPEFVPVEDHDLFLRLAEVGKLANLPEVLFKYRKHSASAVTTLAHRRVNAMQTLLEAAWARRNIPHREGFPAILPDVDGNDPKRELKLKRNWSWLCLKNGNVETARKYAFASLREAPLAPESWKILYCALRGY